MALTIRVSAIRLVTLAAVWFAMAACNDSNPPSVTYTPETSIYAGMSAGGADSTDSGSTLTCDVDPDAAVRPFACGACWTLSHPLCGVTLAQEAIAKGISCVGDDQQVCYKTCGPVASGYKSETCSGGIYVEQSDCSFDPECDFSCFKLPATAPAECPTTAPTHGTACSIPDCTVCGGTATVQTTGYFDSKHSAKIGFCVCVAGSDPSTKKWSCATGGTIWPCPGHKGC